MCILKGFFAQNMFGTILIMGIRNQLVLVGRKEGGHGVSSLFCFNRAMFFRWRWRFSHNPDVIQVHLLMTIYGSDGGCSSLILKKRLDGSLEWCYSYDVSPVRSWFGFAFSMSDLDWRWQQHFFLAGYLERGSVSCRGFLQDLCIGYS